MIENLFTFVRTLGNQRIEGKKFFVTQVGLLGTLSDNSGSIGTAGKVLSSTGSGVSWITVGSSDVQSLNDLTDVVISTAATGNLLRYDGTSWVNWAPNFLTSYGSLNDLSDVDAANPDNGQILRYNDTTNTWYADDESVLGIPTLQEVTDEGSTTTNSITAANLNTGGTLTAAVVTTPLIEREGVLTINSEEVVDQGDPNPNLLYVSWMGDNKFVVNADGYAIANAGFKVVGGTSSGFLKANGTVDTTTYLTSYTETQTLDAVTDLGNTTTNTITVGGVTAPELNYGGLLTINADSDGGLQPEQGNPAVPVLSFEWAGTQQGYIDTDGKITFNGFKTPTGTSSGFLKANGTVDTNAYITEVEYIDDIGDVTISSAAVGDVLMFDGAEWVNSAIDNADYVSKVQHEVKAGVAITKGQAVYVTSADGTNMIVGLASNASEATSSKTIGLALSTAAINGHFFVITEGLIDGLNTASANAGDAVWLGTNGNLIFGLTNKPVAPAHLVYLGVVTRSNQNNGEIFVSVQNGFELQELHNVLINGVSTGQLLRRDSDGLWKNWTPNYITADSVDVLTNKRINLSTGLTSATPVDSIEAFLGQTDIALYQDGIDKGGTIDIDPEGNITISNPGIGYYSGPATTVGGTRFSVTVAGNTLTGTIAEFNAALTDGDFATQAYVSTQIANLVDGAPTTLDTLNELAAALGDDANFATTVATSIGTKQNQLNGTGFVKANGTTITYDNSSYITTESDPVFVSSAAYGITTENIGDWNTAFGWGNHADAGYLTSLPDHTHTISDVTGLQTALDGKVPTTRTITINGTAFDLSANRSWTISSADGYISDVRFADTTIEFTGEGSAFNGSIDLSTLPFAASSHTHTIANVTGLQTALDGKAALSHNHDDRYYTETESDSRFVNVSGDTMSGSLSFDEAAVIKKTIISDGFNPVKTASGVLAAMSANSSGNTYYVIETNVPQDEYQMGGFTIEIFGNYYDKNSKTKVDLGGYWNPESNGGFEGFEAHGTNPQYKPTIQVSRNSIGNTAFIISGVSWQYPIIVARDLWLGYNSTDGGSYGEGWSITGTNDVSSYSNRDTVVWRNAYSDSNPAGYITGYTETDTLATVTGRGSVTSTPIRVESGATGLGGYMSVGNSTEVAGNYSAYFFGNTASDANYFKGGIAYETIASTYGRGNIHFLQNSSTSGSIVTLSDSVMTILNNGLVGIGTTGPETKLQVEQTIAGDAGGMLYLKNSTESSGTYTGIYFGTWGRKSGIFHKQGSYGGYGTGDLIFATNSALNGVVVSPSDARMVITNPGNVGIGTTAPNTPLEVRGSSGDVVRLSMPNTYAAGAGPKLSFWNAASEELAFVRGVFNETGQGNRGNLLLGTRTSDALGVETKMTILHNGNVGIGTVSPTAKLQVGPEAHSSATGIEVAAGAGGANLLARDSSSHHNWFPYTDGENYYSAAGHSFRSADHGTPWVTITASDFTWGGNTVATRTWVTSQGYLTSLPSHNHDDRYYTETESDDRYVNVSGDTMTGNFTLKYSTADSSDYNGLMFAPYSDEAGLNDYIIKAASDKGVFGRKSFGWHVHSESAFGVYSNGWVKLFGVEGDTGNTQVFGSLTVDGSITENSSIRYKKDVVDIEPASSRVELLRPVRYKKIKDESEEIGLIAEDVAELFPEVVKYDNQGRPDGVNYSRLSVILLKAVQELTERVNKLENK